MAEGLAPEPDPLEGPAGFEGVAALLDLLPAAVAVWDAERRLLFANLQHRVWFDTTWAARTHARMHDVLAPDVYAMSIAHVEAAERGQTRRYEGQGGRLVHIQPRRNARGQLDGHVTLVLDNAAERELAASSARLAALVTHSPDAVLSTDLDGRILSWNAAAEKLFGYGAHDVVGQHFRTLVPAHLVPSLIATTQRMMAGESVAPFEMLRLHRDGSLLPVSVSVFAVHDAGGKMIRASAILRDITELKATEAALRDSEQQFRALASASPLGVFHTDDLGQCAYTNEAWQRIYGLTLEQSLGNGWVRALYPEDADAVFERWQQMAARGAPFDMRFRIRHADGGVRHVHSRANALYDERGAVTGYVGAVQDITEQVRADMALHTSQQRLRQLYEATPAMLFSADAHGRLLSVSDAWLAKMRRSRAGVLGRMHLDFLAEPSRRYAVETVWPQLLQQGRVDNVPLQLVAADGIAIDVVLAAIVERGEAAAGQGYDRVLAVMEDVTEALRHRSELQREQRLRFEIERRAEELQGLLAEREEMLGVLAHEVRQPLNNASAALQGAQAVLGPDSQEVVNRLGRAIDVLAEVRSGVDNILAAASVLAADAPLQVADSDIDLLVMLCLGDLTSADRARVTVMRRSQTRTAAMDLGLMRLALRNLLVNALRYSGPGGSVVLGVSDSDEPLALIFDVTDTGTGFDPAFVPIMFERGSRGAAAAGQRLSGGSGLGLHIVQRIMAKHGGRVALVSNEPGHVCLRLTLPPAPED